MIFFMTRKRFEEHVEKSQEDIVLQYGLDSLAEYQNGINKDIVDIKSNIRETVNAVNDLNNKLYSEIEKTAKRAADHAVAGEFKEKLAKDIEARILQKIPAPGISADDARKIVDDAIHKSLLQITDHKKTDKEIVDKESIDNKSIDEMKEALKSELSVAIQQTVGSFYSGIANDLNQKNKEIQQLRASLSEEIGRNAMLNTRIKKQDESILNLNRNVSDMKNELMELRKLLEHVTTPIVPEIHPAPSVLQGIIFGADSGENSKIIRNFIQQTKKLREEISEQFVQDEEMGICLKLVDKCITKMESLYSKNEENHLDADKLANECVKLLKQTIMKAMSQNKLRAILGEYMTKCHIRKLEWSVGKRLEDEDYEYLEEPILYEAVSEERLNNTIRAIKQDTYIIDYIEDDEKYEAVIPGIYCIGRYEK